MTQAQYAYDGLGRRIYKRVKAPGAADRLTVFTWDGDLLQSEESFRGELPPTPYFYSPSEHPELTRENPERKHSIPIAQRQHSLVTLPNITPERRVSYLFEPGSFIPAAKLEAHYKAIEQNTGSGTVLYTDHRLAEQTLYYFQTDHLGTPLELAGSDGNLAWIGQYRAWGKLTKATDGNGNPSTTDNPFRFQGQYHDEETGLHYNRFRYYDPEIGRFTTQDPIGLAGGTNLYQYAPNPTGWVDPLGLSKSCCGGQFDTTGRPLSSRQYSVYAESNLTPGEHYPGRSDRAHFQEGNRQLHEQFQSNPNFAASMDSQYPGIVDRVKPGPMGAHTRAAPYPGREGLTWHHHPDREGVMQLVPRAQHQAKGSVQEVLHPGGRGGMENWGGGR
ncbi:RHS repeat-associated core domain-containing protein [Halomonas sp. V046]|uniref:RHS repeat-associated core domain-containing protein n=1 Tax=Halomonas sp. V046 TaxID=3459611 RepID=UPI004043AF08